MLDTLVRKEVLDAWARDSRTYSLEAEWASCRWPSTRTDTYTTLMTTPTAASTANSLHNDNDACVTERLVRMCRVLEGVRERIYERRR